MKSLNFILIATLGALGFTSCKDDSNSVTPTSTCRLDSYGDNTYRFEAKYDGSQKLSEQTSFYGQGATDPYYQYKYAYPTGKVEISSAYVLGGLAPAYALSKTYKLNSEGLPLEIIGADGKTKERFIYSGNKISYSVDKINNDSIVYTYDVASKNIVSSKFYSYKNAAWIFSYEESYTYDTKVNPFYKMLGYRGDDLSFTFWSANNLISVPSDNEVYTYTYNDKGYPISGTLTFGSKGNVFFYTYNCQ